MGGASGEKEQTNNKDYFNEVARQSSTKSYSELYKATSAKVNSDKDPKTTLIPAYFPTRISDYPTTVDISEEITSIIIMFDVTASMGQIPEELIKTVLKDYFPKIYAAGIPHPQVAFMAVGDAHSHPEYTPVQMTQFESDADKIIESLQKISLECCQKGGGGHNGFESYDLGMFTAIHKINLQCFEKTSGKPGVLTGLNGNGDARWQSGQSRRKGLFISIGDDGLNDSLPAYQIQNHIDSNFKNNDISIASIIATLQDKYVVHHIHINNNYKEVDYNQKGKENWQRLLPGQVKTIERNNSGKLDDPAALTNLLVEITTNAQLQTNLVKEDNLMYQFQGLKVEKDADDIPNEFKCAITGTLMQDPVTTTAGSTYERKAIEKWFATGKNTDPKTGEKLDSLQLVPNSALKSMIRGNYDKSENHSDTNKNKPLAMSK